MIGLVSKMQNQSFFIKDKIIFTIPASQKKIVLIATAAFCFLAACIAIKHIIFKIKLPNEKNKTIGKVLQKARLLLDCKNIYWLPHPKFTTDQGPFPFNDLIAYEVYHANKFVNLFHGLKQKKPNWAQSYNEFLLWLNEHSDIKDNEKKAHLDDNFEKKEKIVFMNCNDFVFFTLYSSGLITKKQIQKIYEDERHRQFNNINNGKYFDIPLNQLETFTPNIFNSHPGDIIVCFDEDDNPVHMMIEEKHNQAFSLWAHSDYRAAKINLKDVPIFYAKDKGGKKLKMKRCSLNLFLKQIQGPGQSKISLN